MGFRVKKRKSVIYLIIFIPVKKRLNGGKIEGRGVEVILCDKSVRGIGRCEGIMGVVAS